MRVVLVSAAFFPHSVGGGEVQVLLLARSLVRAGHDPIVLSRGQPAATVETTSRKYEEIPVVELRGPETIDRYDRPQWQVTWATEWLREQRVDAVHLFLWSGLLGLVSAANAAQIPVVHTALEFGYFCRRFDLRRDGRSPCALGTAGRACETCSASSFSRVHRFVAAAAQAVPAGLGAAGHRFVRSLTGRDLLPTLGGRAVTAAIERQRDRFDEEIAAVITPSHVMRDFYLAQGVAAHKLHLIPYGIEVNDGAASWRPSDAALRVAFLGRLDPAKGLHVLIGAFKHLPADMPIRLDIWAPERSGPAEYVAGLRRASTDNRRIQWRGALDRGRLDEMFADTDLLAVPSVWDENAPVVILEALAHGCPILCTRGRGTAELVQDGVNGLTVPMADAGALAEALRRLAADPDLLRQLREHVRRPATSDDVVARILPLYRHVPPRAFERVVAAVACQS